MGSLDRHGGVFFVWFQWRLEYSSEVVSSSGSCCVEAVSTEYSFQVICFSVSKFTGDRRPPLFSFFFNFFITATVNPIFFSVKNC